MAWKFIRLEYIPLWVGPDRRSVYAPTGTLGRFNEHWKSLDLSTFLYCLDRLTHGFKTDQVGMVLRPSQATLEKVCWAVHMFFLAHRAGTPRPLANAAGLMTEHTNWNCWAL